MNERDADVLKIKIKMSCYRVQGHHVRSLLDAGV
jgi:hypothetical protein